ncbi:MAG TPA: carboxypeptidase-like regulatory domain-containing protein [Acidobacteriaceae bacterium]|jgi:uncharacterized protein (DUF2141 family)
MHRFIAPTLIAAALVFPVILRAQDTEQFKAGKPGHSVDLPKGRLLGTVICTDTRKPARGAVVIADLIGERGTMSNTTTTTRVAMDGTYTLDHLPPGNYAVLAIFPGYLSPVDDMLVGQLNDEAGQKTLHDRMARSGVVTIGNTSATLDLTLERGAAVSGRVSYSDGSPATQITIDMESTEPKNKPSAKPEDNINMGAMMRMIFTHQSANTDDLGHFRISGLQPGKYRVAAVEATTDSNGNNEGMGWFADGMVTNPRALRVYSGDTLHKSEAKVYDLRGADEVSDIEITLPVNAFHIVRGAVTARDGRPLNTGQLNLTDNADASLVFHARLQRDGTFQFATVPNGTYTLSTSSVKLDAYPEEGIGGLTPTSQPPPVSAFADANIGVIVKDSDVPDVLLALTELPPTNASEPSLPILQDSAPH